MNFEATVLRQPGKMESQSRGSGGVTRFTIGPGQELFQITTFCPETIGPGATHCYLIRDDNSLILVDTGLPTDIAKRMFYAWRNQEMPEDVSALPGDWAEEELISGIELTGHRVQDLDYIIITHGHYDHYLMGQRLVEISGAKIAAHVSDIGTILNPWTLLNFFVDRLPKLLAIGMPLPKSDRRARSSVSLLTERLTLNVDCPLSFDGKLSLDSFEKDTYEVLHLPGHSPGGIGLIIHSPDREQAILLAGDNILAPITPHPDDLLLYLRTLNKLTTLNNVALVLPGHGDIIFDFKERLTELQHHHRERLKFTYDLCQNETSIWQIATTPGYFDVPVSPDKFNPLAGHEAFIHVEMLELANGVSRTDIKNGVHYFKRSAERFEDVYERVLAIVADDQATVLMRR